MKNKVIIPTLVFVLTVLIIMYSEKASDEALKAMTTAVSKVIPSIFPFMVISSLIVSSGAVGALGKYLPVARLIGLPASASAPMFLGALCGFPLGARTASELFEKGYINKSQAEILISCANNTGPSFLIFVIGAGFWGSASFGVFLYTMQLVTVFFASILVNNLLLPAKASASPKAPTIVIQPLRTSFSQAICSSSLSSLYICGFITFFSVIISILEEILYFIPEKLLLLISATLEFSKAAEAASAFGGPYGAFFCGLGIGWSGLSVMCQTSAFTSPLGLSLKRYALVKAIEGILLGICSYVYAIFNDLSANPKYVSVFAYGRMIPSIAVFFILVLIYLTNKIKNNKYA